MPLPPPLPDAPMPPPAPAATAVRKGWWQRHWKWAMPLSVLMSAIVFVAGAVGLFSLSMRPLRDNDAYRVALAAAQADDRLVADLGQPIEPRWWVTGTASTNADGGGEAALRIPIEGPRGKGNLFAMASRERGEWRFYTLFAILDGSGRSVDLMGSLPPGRRAEGSEVPAPGDRDECPVRRR